MYHSFTSGTSASLAAGEWLKPKSKAAEDEGPKNPLEGAGMDNAMEGMKKQAVMMYVQLHLSSIIADVQGAQHDINAIHLSLLFWLCTL